MDWLCDLANGTEHPSRSSRVYQRRLRGIKASGSSGRLIWPVWALDARFNRDFIIFQCPFGVNLMTTVLDIF